MSVLTVAEARSFEALASVDAGALQLMIDDVESEIVRRFGAYFPEPHVEIVSVLPERGPIVLARRVSDVTEVVETLAYAGTPVPTRILAADDYRLRGTYLLDRLATGTTPAYGWSRYGVVVTAIPFDDTASRKVATVDAIKAEVANSGFASRRIGEYSESTGTGQGADHVTAARSKILRRLRPKAFVLR